MTNEELQAKYESLNSMEDAYAMMKENGYSGTMEDFETLCANAADEIAPLDMDAMDSVAGGISWEGIKEGASDIWDTTKSGFNKGMDWVKKNPELTASIVGGVAVAAIGVTCGVKAYRSRQNTNIVDRTSIASSASNFSEDFGNYVDKVGEDGNWTRIYDNGYSMPLKMD